MLSQAEANKILQNGLTIMAPVGSFQNGLMKGSNMSPLEALIDYNGSYTLEGPSGYTNLTIKKNEYGTGDCDKKLLFSLGFGVSRGIS